MTTPSPDPVLGAVQQLAAQCEPALFLADSVAAAEPPAWLRDAGKPVLYGGHIAFTAAYFLGLYTVLYVARAHKRFTLQVCSCSRCCPNLR